MIDAPFQHYEILGPRASVEDWLAALQDLGTCHLGDALHGLEGEAGIGRPRPDAHEQDIELIRSEAGRSLQAVERVLPPTAVDEPPGRRPDWTMAPGGIGEADLLALRDEAVTLAGRIHVELEALRRADASYEFADAVLAGVEALQAADEPTVNGRALALPTEPRAARQLGRRLRRARLDPLRRDGDKSHVFVLRAADATVTSDGVEQIAEAVGARAFDFPATMQGALIEDALREALEARSRAQHEVGAARAALTLRVREDGARARQLLDSLEDAEGRREARGRLAATEHVAAARVFVRREDGEPLAEHMTKVFGKHIVIRPLAEADDAPTLPRTVAAVPFAALEGLRPSRFGDVGVASVLAVFAPVAVGLAWADAAGGLLLMIAGALLGVRARRGSPRRHTAIMAQAGGLAALAAGLLIGRALGDAGAAWFGEGWGVVDTLDLGAGALPALLQPFAGVLAVIGLLAGAFALYGAVLALRAVRGGRAARARAALLTTLRYAVIAGFAAAVVGEAVPAVAWAWILVPLVAVAVFVLEGARAFVTRFCLDLVGVLRLVAVGGASVMLFEYGFAAWADAGAVALLVVPVALVVGVLAVVADAAHVAIGVPYDTSLGGRELTQPFEPFRRRVRRGPSRERGTHVA